MGVQPALSNLLSGLLAFGWAAPQYCLLGQKNGESIGASGYPGIGRGFDAMTCAALGLEGQAVKDYIRL
jgi:hypothetical protein